MTDTRETYFATFPICDKEGVYAKIFAIVDRAHLTSEMTLVRDIMLILEITPTEEKLLKEAGVNLVKDFEIQMIV